MCQLMVKLKANKCYQELPRYLSLYINDITNTTPGVILIVLLVISLWLFWPYCWLYCFNCIALAVLLIIPLWSYLCSKVFFVFKIIFINCFSNCKRPKTKFTALINHALTSNHLSGSINRHEPLDHLELTSRSSPIPLLPASFRLRDSATNVTADIPLPKRDYLI